MTKNSLVGKKFLLVTAAAVLGFGVAASFIVPSANAAPSTTTAVTTVAPVVPADGHRRSIERIHCPRSGRS